MHIIIEKSGSIITICYKCEIARNEMGTTKAFCQDAGSLYSTALPTCNGQNISECPLFDKRHSLYKIFV